MRLKTTVKLWKPSKQSREDQPELRQPKTPWLFKLPRPFQINSSLLFIAFLCVIAGLAALTGLSEPTAITSKMSLPFYNMWGGALVISGSGLLWGILRRDQLLEKFMARLLSIFLTIFGAWAFAAVGLRRSIVSLLLTSIVVFCLEQRICFINVILNAKQAMILKNKIQQEIDDVKSRSTEGYYDESR